MPLMTQDAIIRTREPRDFDAYPPSATQPDIDPVMLISMLLGPQILKSLVGRAAQAPVRQGFSQADMLSARLQAQARQQGPIMKAEQLAAPLQKMHPLARPIHGGRGADIADSGLPLPTNEPGQLLNNPAFGEFLKMLLKYHRN